MPIYEYKCDACGHELETIQKISDEPLKKCPECGANKLKKVVSAASFQLKGSGWYVTDFKGDKKDNKPKTAEAETKASESKTETKVEKKEEKAVSKSKAEKE